MSCNTVSAGHPREGDDDAENCHNSAIVVRRGPIRLLNVHTHALEEAGSSPRTYAILSHTWSTEEVSFEQWQNGPEEQSAGYRKIVGACEQAKRDGLSYVWVDTCCIDKKNNTELSESINSMFKWYQHAEVCYVHLSDVYETTEQSGNSQFRKCRYFTRGWTLQELIAPREVRFFTTDWTALGRLDSALARTVQSMTKIDKALLTHEKTLDQFSVPQKLSWASSRQTTRIEDRAYSLLGLLDVNLDLRYVLAWRSTSRQRRTDLLAASPDDFSESADICFDPTIAGRSEVWPTNVGIKGSMPVVELAGSDNSDLQKFIVLGCHDTESPENSLALLVDTAAESGTNELDKIYTVDARQDNSDKSTSFTRLGEITFFEHVKVHWQTVTLGLQAGSLQRFLHTLPKQSNQAVPDNSISYCHVDDWSHATKSVVEHNLQLPASSDLTLQRALHPGEHWNSELSPTSVGHPRPPTMPAPSSMDPGVRRNYTMGQGDNDSHMQLSAMESAWQLSLSQRPRANPIDVDQNMSTADLDIEASQNKDSSLSTIDAPSSRISPFSGYRCRHVGCTKYSNLWETKSERNKHEHQHILKDQRAYACNQCEKAFYFQKDLKRHMRVHYESRMTCPYCSREYSRQDNLKRHIASHHGHAQSPGGSNEIVADPPTAPTPTSSIPANFHTNTLEINRPRSVSGVTGPLPRVWFEIVALTPHERFRQRQDSYGNWLPPRPRGSNVKGPASWFQYLDGQTKSVAEPPTRLLRRRYKTYSFYADNNRIFIYPYDASMKQVGDGSGNPRKPRKQASNDNSDESSNAEQHATEDWRELGFGWHKRGGVSISHAMFRGAYLTPMVSDTNHRHLQQLLPERYRTGSSYLGEVFPWQVKLHGELPVLVALVVFSAPPESLQNVLESCMAAKHRLFQGNLKRKWLDLRGLVVGVWYEEDSQRSTSVEPTTVTAAHKLSAFEQGAYPGYGCFVG